MKLGAVSQWRLLQHYHLADMSAPKEEMVCDQKEKFLSTNYVNFSIIFTERNQDHGHRAHKEVEVVQHQIS